MPLSITTNISSLITQRALTSSTAKLNQAIESMSTGWKINHAKDNAANYSISTNMSSKISSYQVAEDNAMMGLDMLNTATGGLDQINDKLSRIRALNEQALNGTYGGSSLKAINAEVNALVSETSRILNSTEYNGIQLFYEEPSKFPIRVEPRPTDSMTSMDTIADDAVITSGEYSISSAAELAKLAKLANSGQIRGGEFVLSKDIDLSAYSTGEGWTPIGSFGSATFDGNGHTISNLYINRPNKDNQGLFGSTGSGNKIKNLALEDVNITGGNRVGGVAGDAPEITNCYVTGVVRGKNDVGGLAGQGGKIDHSYSSCNVSGDVNVGGLVGLTNNGITDSHSTGRVSGNVKVGGLAGWSYADISNCYVTGNVSGNGDVAGLVGYINGSIKNCSVLSSSIQGPNASIFIGAPNNASVNDSSYSTDLDGMNISGGADYTSNNVTSCSPTGSLVNTIVCLQVGIDSTKNSQIRFDLKFNMANLDMLRDIGLDNNTSYLSTIDKLLDNVSAKQTEYGALQNRLESALDAISIQYENLVSSRSTIKDADIAEVSSEYISQQILQQASATLMSTANQTPAIALQLV